jgi:hypothetical protein
MDGKYLGTISAEDIYGAGSLDTVPEAAQTQQKTNPNNAEIAGSPAKSGGLFSIKGSILNQPLVVWLVMVGLLIGAKYLMEEVKK